MEHVRFSSVLIVFRQLMEHVNAPPLLQHIFWNGAELHVEDRTLGEYGIVPDATIYLKIDDSSDAAAKHDQEAAFIEGNDTKTWALVRGVVSLTSQATLSTSLDSQNRAAHGKPSRVFEVSRAL